MDFTLDSYRSLLLALKAAGYQSVLRLDGSCRQVVLRHDVDLRPGHSLRIAQIEAEVGMRSIFYFRAVPQSWDERIIRQIHSLGHEIGYHYESLTTCHGDTEAAYLDFKQNLERLSGLIGEPVKTICMHGSPRSPFDSRDLWKHYDYHELGVDYEPYLDTDFSKTFYLTDTGRRWDGFKVSVRDKVPQYQDEWSRTGMVFHSTSDIVRALSSTADSCPKSNDDPSAIITTQDTIHHTPYTIHPQLLITTHPQRWMPLGVGWMKELFLQNLKNIVKSVIVKMKD